MTVDLGKWLTDLRALHEKAKQGALTSEEERGYRSRRAELARALLAAQGLGRQPGQARRQSLRVARTLQVDLASPVRKERLTTFDVSMGGFSAPMASVPPEGEALTATLRLPDSEPLVAPVKVVGSAPAPGCMRVSFKFGALPASSAEKLEMAIFDLVLAQLSRAPGT